MGQMLQSIHSRGLAGATHRQDRCTPSRRGSGKKCWPSEQFLRLAELLKAAGRSVQVILGEVELERWPAKQIDAFAKVAEIKRPDTLVELLQTIAGGSTFIGNDSGPGHLAGMIGTPTISIFGPKDPARWKPLGPHVTECRESGKKSRPNPFLRLLMDESHVPEIGTNAVWQRFEAISGGPVDKKSLPKHKPAGHTPWADLVILMRQIHRCAQKRASRLTCELSPRTKYSSGPRFMMFSGLPQYDSLLFGFLGGASAV